MMDSVKLKHSAYSFVLMFYGEYFHVTLVFDLLFLDTFQDEEGNLESSNKKIRKLLNE